MSKDMPFYYQDKVLTEEPVQDVLALLSAIEKHLVTTPAPDLQMFADKIREMPPDHINNTLSNKKSKKMIPTVVRTEGERDVWIICRNLILGLNPINDRYLIDLCFLNLFIHDNEGWRTLSIALRKIDVSLKTAIYRVHRNVFLEPSKNATMYRPFVTDPADESAEALAERIRKNRPCRIDIGNTLTVVLAKDYHREKIFMRRHRSPLDKDMYDWTSWKQLDHDILL